MSTYISEGVAADPAITLFANPTQAVLDKVKAAIKTDVLEGATHLNQTLRYVIKTVVWKSLKFKDMEKVAATLDLTKPFLPIPESIVKGYQKLRFLAQDGIVGDVTAAQLVRDAQTVLAKTQAAVAPAPPAGQTAPGFDAFKEFQRQLLMPPFKPATQQTGYTQRPPEPTGTQKSYTTTQGGAMPDTYRYQAGGGGNGRVSVRQTKPIRVRTAFSIPGLVTSILGSIAAIYAVRAIQQHGPAMMAAWKKAKARSRRVW